MRVESVTWWGRKRGILCECEKKTKKNESFHKTFNSRLHFVVLLGDGTRGGMTVTAHE